MNNKNKRPKTIKKIIVLLTLSLLLLFLVNNTFAIMNSILVNLSDTVTAKRIELSTDYEEMAAELLTPSFNEHIIHTYTGGTATVYNEYDKSTDLAYLPIEDIAQYADIDREHPLDSDEILLSKYAYDNNSEIYERRKEDFVGKEITYIVRRFKYSYDDDLRQKVELLEEKKHTFKIAGLYNNIRAGLEDTDGIISNDMFTEILNESAPVYDNTDNMAASTASYKRLYVTIDDYDNADSVADSISALIQEKYGIVSRPSIYDFGASANFYSLEMIRLAANLLASFLIVCTILSLHSYIKDMMNRRKREFGIMKAIGYRSSGIGSLLVKELLLEIIIPLTIVLTAGILSLIIVGNFFESISSYEYAMMDFKLFPHIIALVAAIDVLLPLGGYLMTMRKIRRIEPMEALRS